MSQRFNFLVYNAENHWHMHTKRQIPEFSIIITYNRKKNQNNINK